MRLCALLVSLVMAASFAAGQATEEDPGRVQFDAGVKAYNAGDFQAAKTGFAEALKSYPGNATILT